MRVLVVGSGFEGIYTAYLLATERGADVELIDPGSSFGGIMAGVRHRGVALDLGCQVFDNFDAGITQTLQALCRGKWKGQTLAYGSRIHGSTSKVMSTPDLSFAPPEVVERMLEEVLTRAVPTPPGLDLRAHCEARWGPTAARLLEPVCLKVFGMPATQLDALSRIYVGLGRIRLADSERSSMLRSLNPELDERLAIPRTDGPGFYPEAWARLPAPNLLPVPESFVGFCDEARIALEEVGVRVTMQTGLVGMEPGVPARVTMRTTGSGQVRKDTYDVVVWTLRFPSLEPLLLGDDTLSRHLAPMGMHLFYHFTEENNLGDLEYFQNYDPDVSWFRWSAMGRYTGQRTTEGLSFCCTEIPDHGSGGSSEQAEAVWSEVRQLGLVRGRHDGRPHYVHAPRCLVRYLPGFSAAADQVMRRLDVEFPALLYNEPHIFGRIAAARYIRQRALARL
ncbi:MAG: NAD(P)-binding protein [Candidatus Sericytochromatia bacterium]|nr:NAD(P)-binding protein [Candidatus Sericytochromatia bacterium]